MATGNQAFPPDPPVVGTRHAVRSRTEDAITKLWPRVHVEDNRVRTGIFSCQTGIHVVAATAQAATAGFWWLINPVGSTVIVALRRIEFMSQIGSALATPTSPRLQVERVTFTGTASGASPTPAKVRSADAANTASLRTASTGLTLTAGAAVYAFLPITAITATSGGGAAAVADWNPDNNGMPLLAAGEGLVLRQADNGTASDTRRFVTNIAWEEFTEY